MRKFSTGFDQALASETSTLCRIWKLQRSDGQVLGFTDHDQAHSLNGVIYHAISGFSSTNIEKNLGFAVDNASVLGGLSSELITADDIQNGLYRGAKISMGLLDWKATNIIEWIWQGMIGDVGLSDGEFVAEIVGPAYRLERATGRTYARQCDAEFGDENCGVNTDDYPQSTVCPKTMAACRSQFSNIENFRGFPYLVGSDAIYAAPQEGSLKDGSSRYFS